MTKRRQNVEMQNKHEALENELNDIVNNHKDIKLSV